jgi:L-ascorbate metabolism protein UlaG (beta-lactamase superfamily)
MKIKYLAHAAFLITADDGTRIITDPYATAKDLTYGNIDESADIVTISHDHGDHNNAAAVKGNPQVVRDTTTVKGISIKAIPTFHDDKGGSERGKNNIYCFEVDGIRVCHLGDLGHLLTDNQVAEVGKVHVLLTPVGGHFTIDAKTAQTVSEQVRARVIIPMHYKTEKIDFPISGLEEFLKDKDNVTRLGTSEVVFTRADFPASPTITVLQPSL